MLSCDDVVGFILASTLATYVSGGKMLNAGNTAGRRLKLGATFSRAYWVVFYYLMGNKGVQYSEVLLGVAKLAKYGETCVGN